MALVEIEEAIFSAEGRPLSGAKVWVYSRGTTTPVAVFSDAAGTAPLTLPLNTVRGNVGAFVLAGSYDLLVQFGLSSWTQPIEVRDATTDGVVAVIREAPMNIQYPEFGAKGDGTDATVAFQTALAKQGPIYVPPGSYPISATLSVPQGASIEGSPFSIGKTAALYHNFSGNMFELDGSATLRNMYLINNGAYSGAAVHFVSPAGGGGLGFIKLDGLTFTDFTADRGWERNIYLDSTLGTIGVRSVFINACECFGVYTPGENIVIKRGVHVYISNTEVIQAPQTTVVQGVKIFDGFSEDIQFNGCSIDGDFYTEAGSAAGFLGGVQFVGRIRDGRTITCAVNSHNNIFLGRVHGATFVNNGDVATNRREFTDIGYRTVLSRSARIDQAVGAATYLLDGSPVATSGAGTATAGLAYFPLDPADWASPGRVTKLRVRASVLTNNVAPGTSITIGLVPASGNPAGGAGAVTQANGAFTSGTVLSTPAVNTPNLVVGADFAAPAAGWYALAVSVGGAMAANSSIAVAAQLQVKNV